MDFLENGRTTREMILETLGRPASPFENGRVHTYQIGRREGAGYFVFESPAQAAKDHSLYNLLLIFDEKGILMKHALLRVR